jgi:hypothetical protein
MIKGNMDTLFSQQNYRYIFPSQIFQEATKKTRKIVNWIMFADLSITDPEQGAWFEKKRAIIRERGAWSPTSSYFALVCAPFATCLVCTYVYFAIDWMCRTWNHYFFYYLYGLLANLVQNWIFGWAEIEYSVHQTARTTQPKRINKAGQIFWYLWPGPNRPKQIGVIDELSRFAVLGSQPSHVAETRRCRGEARA